MCGLIRTCGITHSCCSTHRIVVAVLIFVALLNFRICGITHSCCSTYICGICHICICGITFIFVALLMQMKEGVTNFWRPSFICTYLWCYSFVCAGGNGHALIPISYVFTRLAKQQQHCCVDRPLCFKIYMCIVNTNMCSIYTCTSFILCLHVHHIHLHAMQNNNSVAASTVLLFFTSIRVS